MAKASRSSKKQPAFDPSELEDLIFSPAVGKGVGSHLVTNRPHVATVVISAPPTPLSVKPAATHLTTVVNTDIPTVVMSELTTVDAHPAPPIIRTKASTQHRLWITENGDLVSEARVKRIRLAQDVINSAEESVYDTLWNSKLIQSEDRESCRLVQAGYDYLVKRTRLARKTIQRIIAKLLEKDFIAIETRADIYERTATVYRVFSYKAVLEHHLKKGRLHVAKMGPGFSYAKLLEDSLQPVAATSSDNPHLSTVVMPEVATMAETNMTTVVNETTVTVVKIDPTTVVKMSRHLLDTDNLDNTSSSGVQNALSAFGFVDDDVVAQLVNSCRRQAPDCTAGEMIHFIEEKGNLMKRRRDRVYNPVGFLVTAVPKCFSAESLTAYRKQKAKAQEVESFTGIEENAAMERWRREQEASLSDPNVSEQEKHLIKLCLGLNTS